MAAKPRLMTALVEGGAGWCPVCSEHYAADPDCYCSCTRPQPGDAEEERRALATAAKIRQQATAWHTEQRARRAARHAVPVATIGRLSG